MRKRVVVTGLGCISPLGNDVSSAWSACAQGQSGVISIQKFDASAYRSQIAGEVKDFELPDFLTAKEAKKMDFFIHYALAATQEAMKDADLEITEELSYETGVSVGVGIGGLGCIEVNTEIIFKKGPRRVTPFFIPMTLINMAPGQISMYFNAKGYNASTVSACTSSNHSIGMAARIIERGDATVMISGGSESSITQLGIAGFAAMRALSTRNDDPQGASRPYDQGRDGFVMGEGSGILILEEMEFAKKRGAHIYCELSGFGFSADAHHITSPSAEGPARAMTMAMKDAALNPEDIDYINAHGTSTPIGDVNEINAIKLAMGEASKTVSISATKSMTGHLLGASGALESVLSIKSMQDNIVPPTINIESIDPQCDLDVTPNTAKERPIHNVMSNAFGFGGTNASLVFQKV